MAASFYLFALALEFVQCFTRPGFSHFLHFLLAHGALAGGVPHCLSETLRLTRWHEAKYWTSVYAFLKKGRFSCAALSRRLLEVLVEWLPLGEEMIVAVDDTLVKKWGRKFFALGLYRDATDKNPGSGRRKVWGHCWVVAALLHERGQGQWLCFPLAALLFVPLAVCPSGWRFQTKIALAFALLERLALLGRRVTLVVDNLYAKAELLELEAVALVSRLKSNAVLHDFAPPRRKGQRGAPRKKGRKVSARALWRRKSKRRALRVHIYGKWVEIEAFVDILQGGKSLGYRPLLVLVFPQRSGKKMNVFFSSDVEMRAERVLELYAARFRIESLFRELKHGGGMGDYRQRSLTPMKRHVTLTLLCSSLLTLVAQCMKDASRIEAEPWWSPGGPPSVSRLRRACARAAGFIADLLKPDKPAKIPEPWAKGNEYQQDPFKDVA